MHVIFIYFVRGGFHMKIKCMRKVQSNWEYPQRLATVRKFHAYERSESPGYENWVRTKYSGFTVQCYTNLHVCGSWKIPNLPWCMMYKARITQATSKCSSFECAFLLLCSFPSTSPWHFELFFDVILVLLPDAAWFFLFCLGHTSDSSSKASLFLSRFWQWYDKACFLPLFSFLSFSLTNP